MASASFADSCDDVAGARKHDHTMIPLVSRTPLYTITFSVRRPISINKTYAPNRRNDAGITPGSRRKGLYIRSEASHFKRRIIEAATAARAQIAWPRNLYKIALAELSYQLYDYRGDTDGIRKIVKDALQDVLYINDRLVQDGPAPLPITTGAESSVLISVDILELRDDLAARKERKAATDRAIARILLKRRAR